MSSFI